VKRLAFVGIATMFLAFFASKFHSATSPSGKFGLSTTETDFQPHSGFGVYISGDLTSAQFTLTELPEEPASHLVGSSFWCLLTPHKIQGDRILDRLFWDTTVVLSASLKRLIFPFHSFW